MAKFSRKSLLSLLGLLLLQIVFANGALGKSSKAPKLPQIPGDLVKTGSAYRIILESGRSLVWPPLGPLTLFAPDGKVLAKINLAAKPRALSGAEAMDLEVEETDLGGSQGGRYLQGKKSPRGRAFNPATLKSSQKNSGQGETQSAVVQGVPVAITKYPNESFLIQMDWGKTVDRAFFDRRNTLVYVTQKRKSGPFDYTLKQWSNGSFMRSYRSSEGEFQYTYDASGRSYRLTFANPKGEIVAEVSCDPKCSLD